jgi:hypothetical protein
MSKLDKFKADQAQRVAALEAEAGQAELRASLIEYNLAEVDAAITALNEALATGEARPSCLPAAGPAAAAVPCLMCSPMHIPLHVVMSHTSRVACAWHSHQHRQHTLILVKP